MRMSILVASIVASSAVASAQTKRDPEQVERVSYTAASKPRVAPTSRWIELATPTSARYGTEYFLIRREAGRFSQLRLDLYAGYVIVTQVRVTFIDGRVQTSNLRRTLDATHRQSSIDLVEENAIDTIAVTTERWTGGSYELRGWTGPLVVATK